MHREEAVVFNLTTLIMMGERAMAMAAAALEYGRGRWGVESSFGVVGMD